jgi:hypothetical protein
MDFVNESGLPADWTLGFEPDGRELLVVVVKATYTIPSNGEEAILAEEQAPLTEADEFTGEPGLSAPLRETDYAHRKPRCDVVLNGSAYAPEGRPADRVRVSLRVASIFKSFYVFGDRKWDGGMLSVFPTAPEPFTRQPISYGRAFGGVDMDPENPERVETYRENPVGVGFHPIRKKKDLLGEPLPNTAEGAQPIESTTGQYRPMSFGPVARNFFPRYRLAGTYDQEWLANRAPFWPDDFSYAYFQATSEDQQTAYLKGGEEVVLENLTPDGFRSFTVPGKVVPITALYYRHSDLCTAGVCDTLLIEPDKGRFCMTWRLSLPLRRNCFEVKQLIVGERPYSWHSARRAELAGKTYYRSLAELVDAKRGRIRSSEELEE